MDEWIHVIDVLGESVQLFFHGRPLLTELSFLLSSLFATAPTWRRCRCWQYLLVALWTLLVALLVWFRFRSQEHVVDIVIKTLLFFLQELSLNRWPLLNQGFFIRWRSLPVRLDRSFCISNLVDAFLGTFDCLDRLKVLVVQQEIVYILCKGSVLDFLLLCSRLQHFKYE